MADISELESRITAALDRISNGVNGMAAKPAAAGEDELATLRESLDAEKTASAQLQERVKSIRTKSEAELAELREQLATLQEKLSARDADAQRLETVNAQLRSNNKALREANESGVGDPHLINKAMMAELDSLRVSRDSDRAELDAILSELKPLVEGRADA